MNKNTIIAIDPAFSCGWAISKEIYGVWQIKQRADESHGMRLIRLRSKLNEIYKAYPTIKMIVYERPAGRNTKAIITQSKIIGIIEAFAVENGIQYRAYSAGEIKRFASGKGNCNKEVMIQTAKDKYNYQGDDDNEADALHLLHLAADEYGVLS